MQTLATRLTSAVFLGASPGGKGALIGVVSPTIVDRIQAGAIVAEGASIMGGGGSRDPELAQAGGPDGSKAEAAVERIREEARRVLSTS